MMSPEEREELRAAAATLRQLAIAASTDRHGKPTARWNTDATFADSRGPVLCGDYLTRDDGTLISWPPLVRGGSQHRHAYMAPQHSAYAAAMGPTIGLALADWLEQHAATLTDHPAGPAALAVARAITAAQPARPERPR